MNFRRYFTRHLAFRDYYCDRQILKMAIGCFLSTLWVLFETFATMRADEYDDVAKVRSITIPLALAYLLLSVLFFLLKKIFSKSVRIRSIIMEILSVGVCFLTFSMCELSILRVFEEGGTVQAIDQLMGWILGWTLYTLFCYFPFYWYIFTLSIGYISFFFIFGKLPLEDFPENYILLTIILLIGGLIRYDLGRKNYEISLENRRLIESDRLTGVYNRRSYEERIAELRKGKDAEATLVLFDVNGLKPANDTHGHLAGDELIMATADCISKVFEAHGKCFRIGGDEFVVVMEDNAEDINKLMKQFDETTAQWKGNYSDTLSVSYGIAQGKTEGDGISELIKTADANMYEAKRRYYVEHGIERRVTG